MGAGVLAEEIQTEDLPVGTVGQSQALLLFLPEELSAKIRVPA